MKLGFRLFQLGTLRKWVWGEEVMIRDFASRSLKGGNGVVWVGGPHEECPRDLELVVSMAPYSDDVPLTDGVVNVLWLQFPRSIMWGRDFPLQQFARVYDFVLFGSEGLHRAAGSPRNGVVQYVVVDEERFTPGSSSRHPRVVFVGNYNANLRSAERTHRFLAPLAPLGLEVFGSGWANAPDAVSSCWRGPIAAYDTPALYRQAMVVLSVHGDEHVRFGLPNTRLFEAAASGACVVSDAIGECQQLFGDSITWTEGGSDAHDVVAALLADPVRANDLGKRARETVVQMATHQTLRERLVRLGSKR